MRTWLYNLRTANYLSAAEMAKRLGISPAYYSLIERGERQKSMNIDLAAKIAEIAGIPIGAVVLNEINWEKEAEA